AGAGSVGTWHPRGPYHRERGNRGDGVLPHRHPFAEFPARDVHAGLLVLAGNWPSLAHAGGGYASVSSTSGAPSTQASSASGAVKSASTVRFSLRSVIARPWVRISAVAPRFTCIVTSGLVRMLAYHERLPGRPLMK